MEKVTGIGGVFFTAGNPKVLADWYEQHLGIDLSDRTWFQEAGQTVIERAVTDLEKDGKRRAPLCCRAALTPAWTISGMR